MAEVASELISEQSESDNATAENKSIESDRTIHRNNQNASPCCDREDAEDCAADQRADRDCEHVEIHVAAVGTAGDKKVYPEDEDGNSGGSNGDQSDMNPASTGSGCPSAVKAYKKR